jgi:hypothetical protein
VIYERDKSGAWLARVREVPGCHTYGRSIRVRDTGEVLGISHQRAQQILSG